MTIERTCCGCGKKFPEDEMSYWYEICLYSCHACTEQIVNEFEREEQVRN